VLKVRIGNAEEVTTLLIPSEFDLERRFDNAVAALSLHLVEDGPRWIESEDLALNLLLEEHYGPSCGSDVPSHQDDSPSRNLCRSVASTQQVDGDLGVLAG
jgi:hypothetical protein